MQAKLILGFLCLAILPNDIYATNSSSDNASSRNLYGEFMPNVKEIDKMAEERINILGIFRPINNGCLGCGNFGFTYKGEYLRDGPPEVAMKFTTLINEEEAMEEFKMYTYLGSLHIRAIESFGIPKIYYYGEWEDYIIMALTLLDPEFTNRAKAGLDSGQLNEVDILIAVREFVRITKWIHRRNIFHGDIHFENLMFRGHQGFIIDYNLAHEMSRVSSSGAKEVLPPNANAERRRWARDDWKKFLFSMCEVVGVRFLWSDERAFDHLTADEFEEHIKPFQQDVPAIMEKIHGIRSNELRRIFTEFAELVLEDKIRSEKENDKELFYDYFDRIIREEIENLNPPKPVLPSWLNSDQRDAAIKQLQTIPERSISSIKSPFQMETIQNPPVNYLHFSKKRPLDTAESSGSRKK